MMQRRRFWISALLTTGLLLSAWSLLLSACGREPVARNLLILSVDTLRADALGVAGYSAARTPNIDRLAAKGTYFSTAVTTMPRTTPALGSLLTGRWPHVHGSREVGDPIGDVSTLAEVLRGQGYTTLAVSANATAGPLQKLDRGFAEFVTYEQLIETYDENLYRDLSSVTPDHDGWATAVTREALRMLRGVALEEPWFTWLLYFDPHLMYRPPAPWREIEAERCWALYQAYEERRVTGGVVFSDIGGVATEAVEDCRRLYDAEIAYVDHEIGILLAELEASGHLRNTLILFTADHGENFGEGGLFFEHGDNAHGAGLRVPLIWKGPGIAEGRRDDSVVSLVDVVPTVLALLRIDTTGAAATAPPVVDGVDLSAHLRVESEPTPASRSRVVFAESASALWNEAFDHLITGRGGARLCINSEPYTLCRMPNTDPAVYHLFDHLVDPYLEQDLLAEKPEIARALQMAWKNWPAESARQRVARTSRFKLVQFPHINGDYVSKLFDIRSDPRELVDVREQHPEVYDHLVSEVENWSQGVSAMPERVPDAEIERALKALGYIK